MANTYTLIEAKTLTTTTTDITFTSIPQTYTDLKLVYSARSNVNTSSEGYDATFSFNGATSNRLTRVLRGDGTFTASNVINESAGDFRLLRAMQPTNYTGSVFSNVEIYVPNYTGSNFKSFSIDAVNENNATTADQSMIAGLWSSTAAITSITVGAFGGSLVQYSTFYLYGIKNS